MSTETVDIEFRAKLADFKRTIAETPGLTKKAARDLTSAWVTEIKRAQKEGGSAIEAAARESEKLEKIASAIGGTVGDSIRSIGTLAKGAGAGLSDVGVKLAAVGVAAGAVMLTANAMVSLGTSALSTVRGIDESVAALGEQDSAVVRNATSIRAADVALAASDASYSRLALTLTGIVAPAIEAVGYAVVGAVETFISAINVVEDLNLGFATLTGGTDLLTGSMAALAIPLGLLALPLAPLAGLLYVTADALESLADVGREAASSLADDAAETERLSVWTGRLNDEYNRQNDIFAEILGLKYTDEEVSKAQAEQERKRSEARARAQQAEADRKRKEAEQRQDDIRYNQLVIDQMWAEHEALMAAAKAREAQAEAARQNAKTHREMLEAVALSTRGIDAAFDALMFKGEKVVDVFHRMGTATKEDWANAQEEMVGTSRGFAASIASLADTVSDNQARHLNKDSEAYKKNRRKQFAAHKAAAIAEATINTALSVSKTLSQYAYPVNIVLGALSLAAGVAEIATIAAQKPQFHVGGVVQPRQSVNRATDEVDARLMTGEGVLTRRGVQAVGGPDGVARANRGAPVQSGGGSMVAVAMLDGRVLDTVWSGRGLSGKGGLASRADNRLRGGLTGHAKPRGK